ncbi:hypothetical protein [Arthrobacter silvisoli]|uniref:hypothetical protein n=1 Tax=Arthrobacter silvisoli TaxID=2291022 RepID=UPI001B34EA8F|nr:hypothetical protein [Arthrobacter silvisoli]
MGKVPADPALGRRFLTGWIFWVTLGESVGFLAPAGVQLLAGAAWPEALTPLLILAGFCEGAVLGWFQARVLRPRLPGLVTGRWALLTGTAGALAWALGLLPSSTTAWQSWALPSQLAAGAVLGLLLLCSLGLAQWIELRRHLPAAWAWIPGSAAAWCAGLAVFFAVSTPLWEPGQDPWLVAAIGILGGVGMAVTMAIVSGLVMARLLARTTRGGGPPGR